ncbi:hypothetical protein [Pseudomonas panipatensis]|uniref:Uncharacterized protein n=1 Tax=Pseudomonas panipatensis TaxID=428992 RepID=A0A1G8CUL2_9PSED|nr:hypothetical protein [Pseudomonas panipatensis]SDH48933.1 hypothetical protein SAMN05216272_101769 [Pseudomonas panipatensis]SMP63523.1 hypothetical protein SAMN06295951_10673 [Pseudomonas panipatensis]
MNQTPNPIADAVGTLKLVGMHFAAPTAYPAEVLQSAAVECIERLAGLPKEAAQLGQLYTALLAATPRGWLPHVTLTTDAERPFGAVITDEAGNIAARGIGKSIEGLVALVSARLPVGCGEVSA